VTYLFNKKNPVKAGFFLVVTFLPNTTKPQNNKTPFLIVFSCFVKYIGLSAFDFTKLVAKTN